LLIDSRTEGEVDTTVHRDTLSLEEEQSTGQSGAQRAGSRVPAATERGGGTGPMLPRSSADQYIPRTKRGVAGGDSQSALERRPTSETPLGELVGIGIVDEVGRRGPRPGHIFVVVSVTARDTCRPTRVSDWVLVDRRGRRYNSFAVHSDDAGGILYGADRIAAYGTTRTPKTTKFIFEIPKDFGYIELVIAGQAVGKYFAHRSP